MTTKLSVGPINSGLVNSRTAFVINNDSFPTMINAYQWRGRVKRKRGTSLLCRLRRYFNSANPSYGSITTFNLVAGAGNILTSFSLQSNGNIVPGSVSLTVGGNVYTDPGLDGILVGNPAGSGIIIYSTGAITIAGGGVGAVTAVSFNYYPSLPVMGLEEFEINSDQFPATIAFDTVYSYNIVRAFPYPAYDVSFYKNPDSSSFPGYVRKTNSTPTTWNGQNYQQFWTVNYQRALWTTNGINVPFSATNIGMQYKPIVSVTGITGGPPASATLQITAHGLSVGDFVFVNEVQTTTGINLQTGYVITVTDANNVIVEFPNATIATNGTGGIAQYLTNRSDVTKDCLRWYDGDPTNGNITTPTLNGTQGWVNFAPPLNNITRFPNFSIADLPPAQYYLVGARMIINFKDRLLFLGPVVQTSASGSQVYLQDTVIYSQNGTPYYTASFTGDPSLATTVFNPILLPANQTSSPMAFMEDQTGFGGFVTAGQDQPILTVSSNEDVLIMGFPTSQTRFVYTGNDIIPFNFYVINSELGSSSTFSVINMDKGVISRGSRGYIIAGQTEVQRIDLDIPDQVFQVRLRDNGPERICSQRDYLNEWIYFTYTGNQTEAPKNVFPNQTLQYNYRDNSWAIFNECYTTYGSFRKLTGFTWQTVGLVYPSWSVWNAPWNAGSSTLLQPEVIAGNQQGFVLVRDDGTDEGNSLYIQGFSSNVITSPDHGLNNDDFILITECLGTISAQVNGKIFQVYNVTQNTFELDPTITTGTYFGSGVVKRLYMPFIQTKQFPVAWEDARKTRIGVQRYLLSKTDNAQITLLIFLSQNSASAYNEGPLVPSTSSVNDSLIYSTILYTCPESTNLGLTPSNINLQTPTAGQQSQLWHRINTSLIGDTVQLGFTLSETQMRALDDAGDPLPIAGASQATQCVLQCINNLSIGQLVRINAVEGMEQLNGNVYVITARSDTQITINVNSTGFDAYTEGGFATHVAPINQTAEIELHGFILDVTPSQMLV
jgi:hypothetical protein